MDRYINPPEFLAESREAMKIEEEQQAKKFPERAGARRAAVPARARAAGDWQQDVLAMLRDEAYYFAPQGRRRS
jgi:stage V sporulation protein R